VLQIGQMYKKECTWSTLQFSSQFFYMTSGTDFNISYLMLYTRSERD